MDVLIILVALCIAWITSSKRWRRRFVIPVAIILCSFIGFTSPLGVALATNGLTSFLPVDSGETAESIVVLGRGPTLIDSRIVGTEKLWRDGRSPKIFASGMLDAEYMVAYFREAGIPAQALSGERCSQSTIENALFTSAVLHPRGIQKILLVTDTPHLLRSFLAFRSSGFQIIPHPLPLPAQLSSRQQAFVLLREYIGLASYAITGQFKQRTPVELDTPPPDVTRKLREWKCQV